MTKICSLALCESAGAAFINNRLIIWATGQKPTPFHVVQIEKSPLDVEPPVFTIHACVDEGPERIALLTPYRVVQSFKSGPHKQVVLQDMKGKKTIEVITNPDKLPKDAGTDLAEFAGRDEAEAFPQGLPGLYKGAGTAPIEQGHLSAAIDSAYEKACNGIPPSKAMDGITSVTITGVHARYGGIIGFHEVTVEISASVFP
jgi:hypothetical protein